MSVMFHSVNGTAQSSGDAALALRCSQTSSVGVDASVTRATHPECVAGRRNRLPAVRAVGLDIALRSHRGSADLEDVGPRSTKRAQHHLDVADVHPLAPERHVTRRR